ncbi:MAG TPA: hypothetical protein VIH35_07555 [Kiritimatiellia bacterium]|jgi:hypothetical protein
MERISWVCVIAWVVFGAGVGRGEEAAGDSGANASFEQASDENPVWPAGWEVYGNDANSIALADGVAHSGDASVRIPAPAEQRANQGLYAEQEVQPGTKIEFSAYVLNDGKEPLATVTTGILGIEWHDADGKEVGRAISAPWSAGLSATKWEQFRVAGKAPQGAVRARFVISLADQTKPGSGGCYVDDAEIRAK